MPEKSDEEQARKKTGKQEQERREKPMDAKHPAMVAARSSWRCVQAKDKQGWLELMAEGIVIEDPIGVAPTNPDGKGIRGKAAVSDFWDSHMASTDIGIETHRSFAAGSESAHWMTLTTGFENGVRMTVHGIFTYRVDEAGKLTSLRGYWSLEEAEVLHPENAEH
jgi:steroid delta-isomerase